MTTPGYPDYVRVPLASGKVLLRYVGNPGAGTLLGKFYCGNFQALNSSFQAPGGTVAYYVFTYSYYADSALTQLIGQQHETRSYNAAGFSQHEPLGPYCQIGCVLFNGANASNITYSVYGASQTGPLGRLGDTALPGVSLNAVFPVGVSNQAIGLTVPGLWTFNGSANLVPVVVSVQAFPYSGAAYTTVFNMALLTASQTDTETFCLPDAPISIQINNFNAAPSTVAFFGTPVT